MLLGKTGQKLTEWFWRSRQNEKVYRRKVWQIDAGQKCSEKLTKLSAKNFCILHLYQFINDNFYSAIYAHMDYTPIHKMSIFFKDCFITLFIFIDFKYRAYVINIVQIVLNYALL